MIPIYVPYITGNEKKYLNECIDSQWISSQGKFVEKFEKSLAKFHNTRYCVATSSCTTALHLAIKSLDIGEGDEVICPALTFIAPANMILLSGAKLVLVDIDMDTMTIDPNKIEEKINKKTKAILVVHQFGHSAHMKEILELAKKYRLKVIEDNAESLGGKYKNKKLGTIGDISTLSFFANKIITCGEGGAVLTNNKFIANQVRILRDHGMSKVKRYYHLDLGYNYRMTNMQAAIGLAQMEKLKKILSIRKKQLKKYYSLLGNHKNITLREFKSWTEEVHWLMTLKINSLKSNKNIIAYMKGRGVECRPMIMPVFRAKHLHGKFDSKEYKVSQKVSNSYFHLPSSTSLTNREIEYISSLIIDYAKNY